MKTITKPRKLTRQLFASIYDSARKLRRTDPIQFEVLYQDWKRLRQGMIYR